MARINTYVKDISHKAPSPAFFSNRSLFLARAPAPGHIIIMQSQSARAEMRVSARLLTFVSVCEWFVL